MNYSFIKIFFAFFHGLCFVHDLNSSLDFFDFVVCYTLLKNMILCLILDCCSWQKRELLSCMKCSDLKQLKLDESGKIGYTFKTLGAGFWALKQNDFRKAITKIVLQVDILTDSLPKYSLFLSHFFWNIYFDVWYPLIHI